MKRAAVVTAVLAATVAMGIPCVERQVRTGNDFPIYHAAVRTLLAGGSPYDVGSGLHGYVYLPFFALLLAPLAALPLPVAAAAWYAASLVFAAGAIAAAIRITGGWAARGGEVRDGGAPARWVAAAAIAPLLGLFHDNLVLGQANLLFLALIVVGIAGIPAGRDRFGPGLLLGLATALKMNAALLLVPILIRGRLRAAAGFAAGAIGALLVPFLLLGPERGFDLTGQWLEKVVAPAASGTLQGSKIMDQSPQAGLRRLLVDAPAFGDTRVNLASISSREYARVARGTGTGVFVALLAVWIHGALRDRGETPGIGRAKDRRGTPGHFRARDRGETLLLDLGIACCGTLQITGFHLKAQFVLLLLPGLTAVSRVSRVASATALPFGARERGALAALIAAGVLLLLSNPGISGRAVSNLALAYSSVAVATLLVEGVLIWMRLRPAAG
jgi:hypothetical protein